MSREHYRAELRRLSGAERTKRLAEIITELGEGNNVNENGIYTNPEIVRLPTKNLVEIGVVEGSDGLWRYRHTFSGQTSGGGGPASVFDTGYESRGLALKAGAKYVLEQWPRSLGADAVVLEEFIDGPKGQLSLF